MNIRRAKIKCKECIVRQEQLEFQNAINYYKDDLIKTIKLLLAYQNEKIGMYKDKLDKLKKSD